MIDAPIAKALVDSAPTGIKDTVNDVWGLILGDRVAYFRRKNAIKLSKRLHEEAERLGGKLDMSRVPDQFAFEWGEAATKKDDETLQEMFVRLLANAATKGGTRDERVIYALREMNGEDAKLFKTLYSDPQFRHLGKSRGADFETLAYHVSKHLKFDVEVALDNILRLGLVREITGIEADSRLSRSLSYQNQPKLSITPKRLIIPSALGRLLYSAIEPVVDGSAHSQPPPP